MGNMIDEITSVPVHLPPRIMVQGTPGSGKSWLASSAPGVIFLDLENGIPGRAIPRFARIEDWFGIMCALKELAADEHDFKTLVIDSLSRAEAFCHKVIADQEGVDSIGLIPFGKGYAVADAYWEEFRKCLDILREQRGMTIIAIAHSEIVEVMDPHTGPYSKAQPQMHKRALAKFVEWFDLIGFLTVDRVIQHKGSGAKEVITSKTTGARVMLTQEDGSAVAKCRWTIEPKLTIPKENGFAVIRKALGDAMKSIAAEDLEKLQPKPKKAKKKATEVEF